MDEKLDITREERKKLNDEFFTIVGVNKKKKKSNLHEARREEMNYLFNIDKPDLKIEKDVLQNIFEKRIVVERDSERDYLFKFVANVQIKLIAYLFLLYSENKTPNISKFKKMINSYCLSFPEVILTVLQYKEQTFEEREILHDIDEQNEMSLAYKATSNVLFKSGIQMSVVEELSYIISSDFVDRHEISNDMGEMKKNLRLYFDEFVLEMKDKYYQYVTDMFQPLLPELL